MVKLTEFRIALPLSVEEYRVAQMYMVTKMQKQNTNGKEGVQVLKNEPFDTPELGRGTYTHKVYHLQSKLPSWVAMLAPPAALRVEEEAWNAYPKCKTVMTCPYFTNFKVVVDTVHVDDDGSSENVHELVPEKLAKRKVDVIDIMKDPPDYWSYVMGKNVDLNGFKSKLTGRGPLSLSWKDTAKPIMTCYKLVTIDISYWAFGSRLEQAFLSAERSLFLEGNKRVFAWIDEWFSLTSEDVRRMELETDAAINASFQTTVAGSESTCNGNSVTDAGSPNGGKDEKGQEQLQKEGSKEVLEGLKESRKSDSAASFRDKDTVDDNNVASGVLSREDGGAVKSITERAITVNV